MEKNKIQTLRYTDDELALINNAFGGRIDVLLLVRKFLLQGELSALEKAGLKFLSEPKMLGVLRKTYLPEIDFTAPVTQLFDMWMAVPTKIPDIDEMQAHSAMQSMDIITTYLDQRLNSLAGKESKKNIQLVDLCYSKDKEAEQAQIELGARNTIISHVDGNTAQLYILAGQKKETPEEIKNRLLKDSSK